MTQSTNRTITISPDEIYPVYYEVTDNIDPKYDKKVEVGLSFYARWQKVMSDFHDVNDQLKELYNNA